MFYAPGITPRFRVKVSALWNNFLKPLPAVLRRLNKCNSYFILFGVELVLYVIFCIALLPSLLFYYLNVNLSGFITSIREESADFSAIHCS